MIIKGDNHTGLIVLNLTKERAFNRAELKRSIHVKVWDKGFIVVVHKR